MTMTTDVAATIALLLDTIEDWMAALEGARPLPDTADALAAVDQILCGSSALEASPPVATKADSLLAIFRTEYAEHAARLRSLLADTAADEAPDEKRLIEARRAAHTLGGAAAIVDLPAVASAAQSIEGLLQSIGKHQRAFDVAARQELAAWLNAADASLQECSGAEPNSRAKPQPLPSETTISRSQETVRVSVESLERLTQASVNWLADLERLGRFTAEFDAFQRDVLDLDRERESTRRAAAQSRVNVAAVPELEPLAKHWQAIDREISKLVQQVRRLSVEQRRTTWQLQTRSANLVQYVHEARMVPAHNVFHGFRKLVRDQARAEGKEIEFVVNGLDVCADRMVLQELKDPLMHLLRNCVTHGIEPPFERQAKGKPARGRVSLSLEVAEGRLTIQVADDGRGIEMTRVEQRAIELGLLAKSSGQALSPEQTASLLLQSGFTTVDSPNELAGRGMGLSIVQTSVSRLQGQLDLTSGQAGGLRVDLSVPVSVSTHRVLLVACAGQTFAIPARHIARLLRVSAEKLETIEGHPVVTHGRCPVPVFRLADALTITAPAGSEDAGAINVVVLKMGARLAAVSVDALVEQREAVIQPLDRFVRTRQFAGGIHLAGGRIALVLQPAALCQHPAARTTPLTVVSPASQAVPAAPPKILIVDDSFTTRTLEKSILEAHGYRVAVAVDGTEALAQLRQQRLAAVISDIEMPKMDGFALLEHIKTDSRLGDTPVILVTSRDRQEDQRRGLDLGAEAYIVKRKFDHQELLRTLRQFVSPQVERQFA
jgi:two-component system chemotaxis sensor kinase CheA